MDKCKVQEIIRSYPTKKSMLQDKQAELIQLIHERVRDRISTLHARTDGRRRGTEYLILHTAKSSAQLDTTQRLQLLARQ